MLHLTTCAFTHSHKIFQSDIHLDNQRCTSRAAHTDTVLLQSTPITTQGAPAFVSIYICTRLAHLHIYPYPSSTAFPRPHIHLKSGLPYSPMPPRIICQHHNCNTSQHLPTSYADTTSHPNPQHAHPSHQTPAHVYAPRGEPIRTRTQPCVDDMCFSPG